MAYTKIILLAVLCVIANVSSQAFAGAGAAQRNGYPNYNNAFLPANMFSGFPFSGLPGFPIKIPSPEEIANRASVPGQNFNSMVVSSHSGTVRDKDGKIVPVQDTSFVANNNGKVIKYENGKTTEFEAGQANQEAGNQANRVQPVLIPQQFLNPFAFNPFNFVFGGHIPIPVPTTSENQEPVESHYNSLMSNGYLATYVDENGETKTVGKNSVISDVDGKVTEKTTYIGDHPEDPSNNEV